MPLSRLLYIKESEYYGHKVWSLRAVTNNQTETWTKIPKMKVVSPPYDRPSFGRKHLKIMDINARNGVVIETHIYVDRVWFELNDIGDSVVNWTEFCAGSDIISLELAAVTRLVSMRLKW